MPYHTVQELRALAGKKGEKPTDSGGTRYIGTTDPEIALKYIPKTASILECGPHFGMFTKYMADHGYHDIHLLDFFDALHFVSKNNYPFHIIDFNVEKMPYGDNAFGAVTAWGIVEHMENPFHFTREVHRVLKPDGIYIMAVPNVFHIMSRLMFFKKGMFPRWDGTNNHIFVLPHGVFEKTMLRYFDLIETKYWKPGIQYPLLNKFSRYLPANQWFGNYVTYVLRKKPFVEYT